MKWLLRRGQARRCLFEYQAAFADFAECYRDFPDVSNVAFEYARCAVMSDEPFHELDSIANSLASQPSTAAMGKFLVGLSATRSGDWERAIRAYSDALALEPHWETALEMRAYCYYRCKRPELCVGDLEKASAWPEAGGAPAGQTILMRSAALTEMGQYEQARAILAAANHSSDITGNAAMQSDVQLGLWIICAWQRKFAECTLLAESLVALTPKDSLPHRLAAESYSAQGFEERAIQSGEEALGLRGDKRAAWGTLGRVYYQKGDVENSLRCFVRSMDPATSASPAYQEDALWFAFVLATCPDDRFRNSDLALTMLEKVKEKWGGSVQDAQFLVLQAICLASSGRTTEAAELVRKAIEIPPRPGEAREYLEPLNNLFAEGKAYLHDPKTPADQLIRISAVSVIGCSKRPIGAPNEQMGSKHTF